MPKLHIANLGTLRFHCVSELIVCGLIFYYLCLSIVVIVSEMNQCFIDLSNGSCERKTTCVFT
jgi:hypothetical protein